MTVMVGPIQKGVPVTPQHFAYDRLPAFPFAKMALGDSFAIYGADLDLFRLRNMAAVRANRFAGKERHFATRIALDDKLGWCVRVWRLR